MAEREVVERLVDLVFSRMRVKYCTWWTRRVNTPCKLEYERERWRSELADFDVRQVRDALFVMRRYYQFRPPSASEFARLIVRRESRPVSQFTGRLVDTIERTEASYKFFESVRRILS